MTHEVNSRPLPPAGANAPGAAAHPSAMDRVDGGLEGLWHFLTSMRVAMVLMLAIAVLGIFGSLLMQAPSAVLGDPAAKAEWLDSVRPRWAHRVSGNTGLMSGVSPPANGGTASVSGPDRRDERQSAPWI